MDIVSIVLNAAKARKIDEVVAAISQLYPEADRNLVELVFSHIATGDLDIALGAAKRLLEPQLAAQLEAVWNVFRYHENHYSVDGDISQPLPPFDQEYDHLVYNQDPTLFRTILFYFKVMTRPRKKVAVVVTVRNEGPWLVEWIAHYAAAGIDIICYYNDIEDGSDSIITVCGKNGLLIPIENKVDQCVPAQIKAYEHALFLNPFALDYEWLMFFDADEFLISKSVDDVVREIAQLASRGREDIIDAILVNWRWMSNGFQYEWRDGSLFTRFCRGLPARWVKSIVRPTTTWSMRQFHFPILPNGCRAVDSSGTLVNPVESNVEPPREARLELLHFYSKSFQEFALKKHRGRATQGTSGAKRTFENFAWGLDGTMPFEIPSDVIARTEAKMADIIRIPGMYDACAVSTRWARNKVQEIERDFDLKQEFRALASAE